MAKTSGTCLKFSASTDCLHAINAASVDEITRMPLDNRLALARGAYGAMSDLLSIQPEDDFIDVAHKIKNLSQDEREKALHILNMQKKALLGLQSPQVVRDQIIQVHHGTLRDVLGSDRISGILNKWLAFESKVREDPYALGEDVLIDENNPDMGTRRVVRKDYLDRLNEAVSYDDRMELMQFMSDRRAYHWKKIDPVLFADYEPMQMRKVSWETATPDVRLRENWAIWHSSQSKTEIKKLGLDEENLSPYSSSCIVTDRHLQVTAQALFAMAQASHEEHHGFQGYLAEKKREGAISPESPYYDMVRVYEMNGSGPPGLFGSGMDPLFQAALGAYHAAPWEADAFLQGELMGMALHYYYGRTYTDPDQILSPADTNCREPWFVEEFIPNFDPCSDIIVLPADANGYRLWVQQWKNKYESFAEMSGGSMSPPSFA